MEAVQFEDGLFGLMPMVEMILGDFAVIELWSAAFWAAVGKIVLSNIVLSGDNAVVIAMASRNLPDRMRRRAIFFGSLGAVLLRVAFCAVIGLLLGVPYLKLVGGAPAAVDRHQAGARGRGFGERCGPTPRCGRRSRPSSIADAVMSLDNAIAIAAAAHGNFALITIGLLLSVPVIMLGAGLISHLLDRYAWIGLAGAALIGWIAGEVIAATAASRRPTPAATWCSSCGPARSPPSSTGRCRTPNAAWPPSAPAWWS